MSHPDQPLLVCPFSFFLNMQIPFVSDIFHQFLKDEFDAKAHATRVIQGMAIAQQLGKLAEGINLVDKELHAQVVNHHKDLLSQATGIETLEGEVLTPKNQGWTFLE